LKLVKKGARWRVGHLSLRRTPFPDLDSTIHWLTNLCRQLLVLRLDYLRTSPFSI